MEEIVIKFSSNDEKGKTQNMHKNYCEKLKAK